MENCNIVYLLIVHLMKCAVKINSFDLYVLYNMMVLLQGDDLIWQILSDLLSDVNQPTRLASSYAAYGEISGSYEPCWRNKTPHLLCLVMKLGFISIGTLTLRITGIGVPIIHEVPLYDIKVGVWCATSATRHIGPPPLPARPEIHTGMLTRHHFLNMCLIKRDCVPL
jgi:hypothetical protein